MEFLEGRREEYGRTLQAWKQADPSSERDEAIATWRERCAKIERELRRAGGA